MRDPLDPLTFSFAVASALTTGYMLYFGWKRMQGKRVFFFQEMIVFWYLKLRKGNKEVESIKSKLIKNRRWNLIYGISALIGSPFMLYIAYLFLLMAIYGW